MKKAAKQKVQYSNIQKLFQNGQNSKVYFEKQHRSVTIVSPDTLKLE